MINKNSLPTYINFLPKLGNYAVGITLICYVTGFVIANLYLGSLKIVNLDILRARHILVGVLFLVFTSGILYLTYGLIQTIRQHGDEHPISLVAKIIFYSFQNIVILLFVVVVIGILAGTVSTPPVGLPEISPEVAVSEWLENIPSVIFWRSLKLSFGVLIILLIVLLALALINPKNKDGIKEPRKKYFQRFAELKWRFIGLIIATFIMLFLWDGVISFLNFMTTNAVNQIPKTSTEFPSGWSRFWGGMILIYSLIAVLVTFVFVTRSTPDDEDEEDEDDEDFGLQNPTARISFLMYFFAAFISIVLPVYALGIYPTIPQQIGGGKVIQVEVLIENESLSEIFLSTDNTVYLIDRTSKSSIFLLVDKITKEYDVLEVEGSQIKSILYNP